MSDISVARAIATAFRASRNDEYPRLPGALTARLKILRPWLPYVLSKDHDGAQGWVILNRDYLPLGGCPYSDQYDVENCTAGYDSLVVKVFESVCKPDGPKSDLFLFDDAASPFISRKNAVVYISKLAFMSGQLVSLARSNRAPQGETNANQA